MEIKGIDVSSWQGSIDWKTVSDYGMGFAILRITEKGNKIDSQFENNYKGCNQYNIPVGVYKYSYAKTVAQALSEADAVIKVLNGRKLQFPVFYDLEWSEQRSLGKSAVEKIAVAFLNKIQAAGYKVGIYCNVDWYNSVLTNALKKYDLWIARYPVNDDGWLQERLRPNFGVGWQYSSKAKIPGIDGNVDRNVFYKDYSDNSTQEGGTSMSTKEQAIQAVINIAKDEIGYLEKASNSQLDSKTANAGYNNYTKYWRDVYPSYQAQAWCAAFVSWVFMQAFGKTTATKLLKHWPYVYCPTLGSLFTKYANPEVGDIVIFYRNGTFAHTGIVIDVDGDKFTTIEGNTSGASGIVANGGGVFQKSYYNSNLPGTKFCRPDYSIVTSINSNTSSSTPIISTNNYLQYGDQGSDVKSLQQKLNKVGIKDSNGNKLKEDGSFGDNTLYAVKAFQKKYGLEVDGLAGKNTISKLDDLINAQAESDFDYFVGACTTDSATVFTGSTGSTKLATYPMLNRGNLVDVIGKSGSRYKIKIANVYVGWIETNKITTPDKITSTPSPYPFVGACTGNSVNVRKGAGTNYANISGYPMLNKGNLVDVLGDKPGTDGKKWYQIRIAGKYVGYIRVDYIERQ